MPKDLIVLVADKNAKFTLDGLLGRYQALNIHAIQYKIFIHPKRDPGVYNESVEFLREFISDYHHALVFLDREGSGHESDTADEISLKIRTDLERNGWRNRVEVIVFDPELEIWAWVDSPHLAEHVEWPDVSSIRSFLIQKGFWKEGKFKPDRPKEAFESLLKEKGIPRSSSIYKEIAQSVRFRHCTDPAFQQLQQTLRNWYGSS